RPTLVFTLSLASGSTLPLTAASVSTRVVSWNEAAEKNERVCRLALVMPSRTGVPVAGLFSLFLGLHVERIELDLVDLFARDHVGVALIGDLDLLQHLTDNHLDVLVVDEHALQPVDFLDFVDAIGREF